MAVIKITAIDGKTYDIEVQDDCTCQNAIDKLKDITEFKDQQISLYFNEEKLNDQDKINVSDVSEQNPLIVVCESQLSERVFNLENSFDYFEYPFTQYSYEIIKYGRSKAYKERKSARVPYYPLKKDDFLAPYDEYIKFKQHDEEEEIPEVTARNEINLPTILTDIQAPTLIYRKQTKPKHDIYTADEEIPTLTFIAADNTRVVRRVNEVIEPDQPLEGDQPQENADNQNVQQNQNNENQHENAPIQIDNDNNQNNDNGNNQQNDLQPNQNENQNENNILENNQENHADNDNGHDNNDDIHQNQQQNPNNENHENNIGQDRPRPANNNRDNNNQRNQADLLGENLRYLQELFNPRDENESPMPPIELPNHEMLNVPFNQVLRKIRDIKNGKGDVADKESAMVISDFLDKFNQNAENALRFSDEISRISRISTIREEGGIQEEEGEPKVDADQFEEILQSAQFMEEEDYDDDFTQLKVGRVRRQKLLRQDIESIRSREYDELSITMNENYTNAERHEITNLSKIGFDFSLIISKYEENGRDFDKTRRALINLL